MRLVPMGLLLWSVCAAGQLSESARKRIDDLTSSAGAYTAAEDTHRVAFPRTDVKVAVDGRPLHPFLGLTSWAAFTSASAGEVLVMGDIVLFEDEVNPAMTAALDNGLEVTALHNHFFYDTPRVMFMHIGGHGSVERLAGAVRKTLDSIKGVRAASATPVAGFGGRPAAEGNSITAAALDAILGVKGQSNSGMYKVSIGRPARMHGRPVGNAMGVNTWAAFAGTDENAVVDGDFAMTRNELQVVLKTLRQAGINIVAIHNHMTHEEPQYVFLHYWGQGTAKDLATALKQALDAQARIRGGL